ncbi:TIGR04211 family SH3 domain-containing protein [Mannheimia sp. AT1]|uniref:TIGR04211 family SH3 domain-containing protein n=1 Tax=Mannheimia cairinae TaxID=3025936 RepID=A0ABT5MNG2_9PAST|nr:TIGR04211 family SH3 domain-containing protein [Mannheimia cairinae]MDD0823026.1 TIGR04211 family SH3 domain-containing protein [Mannheimia cairinae]MDD0825949.1 TIGR04211 family SH3 domain-containing protein [Mannheimia cairinae]
MRKLSSVILSCVLLGISTPLIAADTYITENLNTYMRKGAGDQYRISGAIQAGEKVTVLEKRERYSLIRDSRNREGWVLNSELSDTASPKELIPQLKQQVQDLTNRLSKVDAEWQQRTAEMQRRTQDSVQKSSDLVAENAQLKRELEILKNKNRDLETMHDSEKREIVIQWFIYGGAVLGVGLLLGLIIPFLIPRRRRNNGGWA